MHVIVVSIQITKIANVKKGLVDKLIDECAETIDEEKLTLAETKNNYKCSSSMVYIVLFSIFFIIIVGIGAYFVYYKYMNRNKETFSKYYDYVYRTENC